MISWSVGSSPALGSVLTAQSLEPASNSVSPSLSAPPLFTLCLSKINVRGVWVAQSVSARLAQVMISWSVGSSPASVSVMSAQNLEAALDSVSPSPSPPPLLALSLFLSQK